MTSICDIEPFKYDATPQPPMTGGFGDPSDPMQPLINRSDYANASTAEINNQKIEDYLNRMREALCADVTAILARLDALEAGS